MSKQPHPVPTASAGGPCPTIIQIVGRPGTGSLPRAITPPDHPLYATYLEEQYHVMKGKIADLLIRFTDLLDSISVYIQPSLRERERGRKKRNRIGETKLIQTIPAPIASTVDRCPTIIQISRMFRHKGNHSTSGRSDHQYKNRR